MYSEIAIKIENLSKCYQIFSSPQDRLKQFVVPPLQRALGIECNQYFKEFWSLKDVSFEVKKGETVGIIGRNGSGKSTLLQLICGTLSASSGTVETHGRVAALLELGSGFNPEFSGRENVYMNGALLGLSSGEIDQRFDDIAAFADIGDFINQPVKTYSSGMYVRLAFAVAINVDPDILIIDEALAVGDEPFQRKCYAKIERIRDSGATILLVTHSSATITQMCSRALLLDNGCSLFMGNPKLTIENYYRLIYSSSESIDTIRNELKLKYQDQNLAETVASQSVYKSADNSRFEDKSQDHLVTVDQGLSERYDPNLQPLSTFEYETNGAQISNVRIENADGKKVNVLVPDKVYWYCYEVSFKDSVKNVHFGMLIKTTTGNDLGAIGSHPFGQSIPFVSPGDIYSVRFPFHNLFSPGTYFMNAGCGGTFNGDDSFLHRIVDVIAFRVEHTKIGLRYAGSVQVSAGIPRFEIIGK